MLPDLCPRFVTARGVSIVLRLALSNHQSEAKNANLNFLCSGEHPSSHLLHRFLVEEAMVLRLSILQPLLALFDAVAVLGVHEPLQLLLVLRFQDETSTACLVMLMYRSLAWEVSREGNSMDTSTKTQ